MVLHAVPDEPDGAESPQIATAVEKTIAALGCPDSDAAVVALARKVAVAIDSMEGAQLGQMLGQTAPLLLKTLQELEERSRKRRSGARGAKPTGVAKQRAAHAAVVARRMKGAS